MDIAVEMLGIVIVLLICRCDLLLRVVSEAAEYSPRPSRHAGDRPLTQDLELE